MNPLHQSGAIAKYLRLASHLIVGCLLLCVLAGLAAAQSKDKSNPTPLTSPEISGFADPQTGVEAYYSFIAGPGKVEITLELQNAKPTDGLRSVGLGLVAEESLLVVSNGPTAPRGIVVFPSRKQKMLLHLKIDPNTVGSGQYRVRISGAVEFSKLASEAPPPQTALAKEQKDTSGNNPPSATNLNNTRWYGKASQEAYRQTLVKFNEQSSEYEKQHSLKEYGLIFDFFLGGKLGYADDRATAAFTAYIFPDKDKAVRNYGEVTIAPCIYDGEWRQQGNRISMKITSTGCIMALDGTVLSYKTERPAEEAAQENQRREVIQKLLWGGSIFVYTVKPGTDTTSPDLGWRLKALDRGHWLPNLLLTTFKTAALTPGPYSKDDILIIDMLGGNAIRSDGNKMWDGITYLLEGVVDGDYITGKTYAVRWFGGWTTEYDPNKQRWLVVKKKAKGITEALFPKSDGLMVTKYVYPEKVPEMVWDPTRPEVVTVNGMEKTSLDDVEKIPEEAKYTPAYPFSDWPVVVRSEWTVKRQQAQDKETTPKKPQKTSGKNSKKPTPKR